jgi:hypothetical protein
MIEFEKGKQFPSEIEAARINQQQKWDDMLNGTYNYIRKVIVKDKGADEKKVDPLVPLPTLISDVTADLLFGEFPVFTFGEDNEQLNQDVDEFLKNWRSFKTDVLSASGHASAMGTMFWYLFKMQDKTFYKFIKPTNTIWEEDLLGLTNVAFFHITEIDTHKKWIKYEVQLHKYLYDESIESPLLDENRKYVHSMFEITVDSTTNKIKNINELQPETDSGLNFIPITKIENINVINNKNGRSDYQGKEQLFAEIDNRIDEINHVLAENAEPWLFVPPGILNEDGNFNRSRGKMIEKAFGQQGTDSVDIITWDGRLEASFKAIDKMIQMVLFTSRISKPIAGFNTDNVGGQVDSGRALKWQSINTTSMITRKRTTWDEAFIQFFEMLFKMDSAFKEKTEYTLNTLWKDGLPLDDEAIIENIVKQVQNGLLSHLTGIQKINEVDEDQAQEELDKVSEETEAKVNLQNQAFKVEI